MWSARHVSDSLGTQASFAAADALRSLRAEGAALRGRAAKKAGARYRGLRNQAQLAALRLWARRAEPRANFRAWVNGLHAEYMGLADPFREAPWWVRLAARRVRTGYVTPAAAWLWGVFRDRLCPTLAAPLARVYTSLPGRVARWCGRAYLRFLVWAVIRPYGPLWEQAVIFVAWLGRK